MLLTYLYKVISVIIKYINSYTLTHFYLVFDVSEVHLIINSKSINNQGIVTSSKIKIFVDYICISNFDYLQ